jgi:hypothetical protein
LRSAEEATHALLTEDLEGSGQEEDADAMMARANGQEVQENTYETRASVCTHVNIHRKGLTPPVEERASHEQSHMAKNTRSERNSPAAELNDPIPLGNLPEATVQAVINIIIVGTK